jgi:D-alanine transaminase
MQLAMIDDKLVGMDELAPCYLDRGIFFGDGVYEVMRSYNGRIFALEEHMERFANSLAAIEISGVDLNQVRVRVKKAFESAKIENAKIYFHITRGSAPRNHNWDGNLKPNFFLTISEIEDSSKMKEEGVSVSIYPDMRWKRCDIKSLNLLPNVLAHNDAARKGCFDAILINDTGLITEGSSSAFFAIFGKKLQTTPLGTSVLPSITRKFVLKAAKNIGLGIIEESMTVPMALCADELFLGVTTKDIIPVIRFDERKIGTATCGRYTKQLIEEFHRFTE